MMQTILWKPTEEQINHSQMMQFIHFVHDRFNLTIEDYPQLYDWSIEKAEDLARQCVKSDYKECFFWE